MVYWFRPTTTSRIQGFNGTNWVNLLAASGGYNNLYVSLRYLDNEANVFAANTDARSEFIKGLFTNSLLYGYNGASWDRIRSTLTNIDDIIAGPALVNAAELYVIAEGTWKRFRQTYKFNLGTFTAAGAGSGFTCPTGASKHTWMVLSDASTTAATVNFEGSIDGTNWFVLDTWTGTGNTMRHVVNKPVKYVRANVTSMGDATSITVQYYGMP